MLHCTIPDSDSGFHPRVSTQKSGQFSVQRDHVGGGMLGRREHVNTPHYANDIFTHRTCIFNHMVLCIMEISPGTDVCSQA